MDIPVHHERAPSSKSFETSHSVDTDISMPSHIQIPNLPTVQEAVLRIGDTSALPSQPDSTHIPNDSVNQASDTGDKKGLALADVVHVSTKHRPLDEFGFFQDSIDATPSSELK